MGTLPASHTGTQGGDCPCLPPFLSLSCLPAPLWLAALTLGLGPLVSTMLHVGACAHVGMLRVCQPWVQESGPNIPHLFGPPAPSRNQGLPWNLTVGDLDA